MTKLRAKKTSTTKQILILISILLVAIFSVKYYWANKTSKLQINEIGANAYGPVELVGTIFKETPVGVPGTYLLVNLAGKIVELEVSTNIDNLNGQSVIAKGELIPPRVIGDKQILVVSSIQINP